ncbi:hypothetical protein BLNAU_19269 [Blattamonas nauphoetae]|nr:hypothetical protein BLNAU_19269 [Blattamonas nauphoetae]
MECGRGKQALPSPFHHHHTPHQLLRHVLRKCYALPGQPAQTGRITLSLSPCHCRYLRRPHSALRLHPSLSVGEELMRVWLAVVNVFHLSLDDGTEDWRVAASEIDAGVLSILQMSVLKESMLNVPVARIEGTDCGAEGQKEAAIHDQLDGAAATDCEHFSRSWRRRHITRYHPDPKSNCVRSEDVCQLGTSVCLLMQSVWDSLDLSVPNEWRVLGESMT